MKKFYLFVLSLLIITVAISGCVQNNEKTIKIGDIISNPSAYEGKTVIISGRYGGWSDSLPCNYSNMAMKTRSDTIVYDDTGCLYMTGDVKIIEKEENVTLNPWNNVSIGSKIKVKGVIKLIDGKPILD